MVSILRKRSRLTLDNPNRSNPLHLASRSTHMSSITRREANAALGAVLAAGPALAAKETEAIALPQPRSKGGQPLIEALALRRSTREYSDRPLPSQVPAMFRSSLSQPTTCLRPPTHWA